MISEPKITFSYHYTVNLRPLWFITAKKLQIRKSDAIINRLSLSPSSTFSIKAPRVVRTPWLPLATKNLCFLHRIEMNRACNCVIIITWLQASWEKCHKQQESQTGLILRQENLACFTSWWLLPFSKTKSWYPLIYFLALFACLGTGKMKRRALLLL